MYDLIASIANQIMPEDETFADAKTSNNNMYRGGWRLFIFVIIFLILLVLFQLFLAMIWKAIWNAVIPDIFGVKPLDSIWQMIGIIIMGNVIMGRGCMPSMSSRYYPQPMQTSPNNL